MEERLNPKSYEERQRIHWGLNTRLIVPKFAGIIVDMQDTFLKCLSSEIKGGLIDTQKNMISYFSKTGIPVFVSNYSSGSLDSEIQSELPIGTKVCVRNQDDALTPELENMLSEQEITHLVIMGLYAECCCLKTAKHADRIYLSVLTSGDLMAPKSGIGEAFEWYRHNGIFVKDYKSLQNKIHELTDNSW